VSLVSTINQKLQDLSARVAASPLASFWAWWVAELRAMLPQSWREKLVAEARPLQIHILDNGYALRTDSEHELNITDAAEVDLVQQQIHTLLDDADLENPEKIFYLNDSDVLQTEVTLPLAAESRLRQALEFDLDRQTPFRASDVYFDYHVERKDKEHNMLHIHLFLVPRTLLGRHIQALHQLGIDLNRVSVNSDDQGAASHLNLLPLAMRARRVNKKVRFNRLLLLVVVVLLAVAMMQSIRVREQYVAELEEAIAAVSKEARMVANMRQQIEDAGEAANFLANREAEYPEDIEVIAEITRILKDDTWVQRLIIKDGEIRVQGLSVEAQRLIKDINASSYFAEAAFLGTTQFDSRAKRERFNLSAKMVKNTKSVRAAEKIDKSQSGGKGSDLVAAKDNPATAAGNKGKSKKTAPQKEIENTVKGGKQ